MKIIDKEDHHELVFSDEEIKIISEKKKLIFTHKGMSQLANALVHVAIAITEKIDKKDLQINTDDNINPKETDGTAAWNDQS